MAANVRALQPHTLIKALDDLGENRPRGNAADRRKGQRVGPRQLLPARVAGQVAAVLTAHGASDTIIDEELRHMRDYRVARTANRSVVGIMNEFSYLAEVYCDRQPGPDLIDLAVLLAATPCGPLYRSNVSPDRELVAFLRSIAI